MSGTSGSREGSSVLATPLLVGLLFWAAIAVLTTLALARERHLIVEQAKESARAFTSVMEQHTARTFLAVDMALEAVASSLERAPRPPHDEGTRELMRAQLKHLPTVRALFVIGPDGFVQHDTDYPTTPDVSLADREYFARHRKDPSLPSAVSAPLQSRSGLGWFVAASRRIGTPGEFRGIVVAAIQLSYVQALYERLGFGKGKTIALLHRDGRLIARYPSDDASVGRSFADHPVFRTLLPRAPGGVEVLDGPPLEHERVVSYRALGDKALVVALSHDMRAILAGWNRAALGAGIGLAGLLLLTAFGTYLFAQRQAQRKLALDSQRAASEARALAEANARLRALIEASPLGIDIMDACGRPVFYNPKCAELHGIGIDEALEGRWEQAVHPDDRERVTSSWYAAAQAGQAWAATYRFLHRDGKVIWVSGRAAPVRIDGRLIEFVGTLEDITDERQAREKAEQASLQRGELLAVVAHDLRNPLSTIVLTAQTLLSRDLPSEARSRKGSLIQRSAESMDRLIGDLLDYSRIEAGRLVVTLSELDVPALCREAVESFEGQAQERDVSLALELAPDLPVVRGDPHRLAQVLSNLLGNALRHAPAGGRVLVRAEPSGQGVRISVEDNGPGIPSEFLPDLFSRFTQADHASRSGAGLGLWISRGIIEAHGGRISAEAPQGGGARLSFTLP